MKKKIELLAIVGFFCAPFAVSAHDYSVGDLVINHPVAYETPRTAMSGAGYLTITNTGVTDDRMVAVEADFPRVMMHETEVTDGIASMIHLDHVALPAGQTVVFEPGGKHVMFMGLNGDPFEIDEEIAVRLIFEKSGAIDVIFKVEARPTEEKAHDHSGH